MMGITQSIRKIGLDTALSYLERNPEENIGKLISFVSSIAPKEGPGRTKIDAVRKLLADRESPWYRLVMRIYSDIDPEVRKTLFRNFILNSYFKWAEDKEKYEKEHDVRVPWTILMDPTSACNLKCTGCWAAEYGNKLNMDLATLDRIIAEAKEMGMHFFIYSGGEPLVRKKDIITLCEKHDDCVFMAFTNGTLIDEEFADDMLRVKNFVPAISVEGFGKATDFRRGNGTYDKVCRAMDILKAHKLPFGVSCCYTKENTEVIGSEEYFDWMIGKGAYFAWFFTYMPIGNDSPSSLMVTASQRAFMYERIRGFRKTKLLFTMDFWNDGEFVGGCIAGGRYYMHINANGDIEPCAFIHYSDSNVKEKSLLEALKSPLFTAYRKNQPFNCNHLRPCPLLDNPDALAKVVDESGAASTDMMSPEDVHELCGKCHEKAEAWAPVADELWKRSHA